MAPHTGREHDEQLADGVTEYHKHKGEISVSRGQSTPLAQRKIPIIETTLIFALCQELVLRLLLLEEAYGRTDVALPDSFSVKHDDYVLDVGKLHR